MHFPAAQAASPRFAERSRTPGFGFSGGRIHRGGTERCLGGLDPIRVARKVGRHRSTAVVIGQLATHLVVGAIQPAPLVLLGVVGVVRKRTENVTAVERVHDSVGHRRGGVHVHGASLDGGNGRPQGGKGQKGEIHGGLLLVVVVMRLRAKELSGL